MCVRSLVVLSVLSSLLVFSVSAEIPQLISYQGKVTDAGGTPAADGDYTMTFTIYDAATSGTALWTSNEVTVAIADGIFSVLLGESPQPALTLDFDIDYWLQVDIAGDVQLPRMRLGSVGYAYMASGLVPGTEVSGSVLGGTPAAFKGMNTASVDTTYGIAGESASIMGRGVMGIATATGGTNFGVYGVSASTAGRGVYGEASATTGTTFGGRFVSNSDAGVGVHGRATDLVGSTSGVVGEALSSDGRGVYGFAAAPTGVTYGGLFESQSQSGRAVYGSANAPTGYTYGVYGYTNSTDGRGVCGEAARTAGTTYGVCGYSASTAGTGVYGYNNATAGTTYGGYFKSASTGGTGVCGEATAASGTTYGVYGRSASTEGRAVCGEATAASGTTYGVYGRSASTEGRAVYGEATADSGSTYGVYGRSASSNGMGVHGLASDLYGTTYGVRAVNYSEVGTGVYGGAWGTGANYGVYGVSASWMGYGVYSAGDFAASGTKSCVVKTSQGPTLMYCQESPENWFEDFGEGELVNGRCHIELDPLFLETVTIDATDPMKVFITPDDPRCRGVAVVRGTTGFEVIELHNGVGDSRFAYRVVAKRKGFEDKRLDYCKAAENDSHLYPELREKELRRLEEERAEFEGEQRGMQAKRADQ